MTMITEVISMGHISFMCKRIILHYALWWERPFSCALPYAGECRWIHRAQRRPAVFCTFRPTLHDAQVICSISQHFFRCHRLEFEKTTVHLVTKHNYTVFLYDICAVCAENMECLIVWFANFYFISLSVIQIIKITGYCAAKHHRRRHPQRKPRRLRWKADPPPIIVNNSK